MSGGLRRTAWLSCVCMHKEVYHHNFRWSRHDVKIVVLYGLPDMLLASVPGILSLPAHQLPPQALHSEKGPVIRRGIRGIQHPGVHDISV